MYGGMEEMGKIMSLASEISDIIILVGAFISAIYVIAKPILKAKGFLQKKGEQRFSAQFEAEIIKRMPALDENLQTLKDVKEINMDQSEAITKLTNGIKNIQRQEIMSIYEKGKQERTLKQFQRERLDELYKDYKAEGGNSFIDKYYARMIKWPIILEEE